MTKRNPKLVDQSESSGKFTGRRSLESFLFWRDPKSSAIVFIAGLIFLLSFAYSSVISIISNISLSILAFSMLLRIYNDVCRFLNKEEMTFDHSLIYNHEFLKNNALSPEKVHEVVDVIIVHLNAFLVELRRLFLVEDLIMSSKFALMFWALRYIGAWFSGLTLVIIGFVSAFTLPKIYENNKILIDRNIYYIKRYIDEFSHRIRCITSGLQRKVEKKEN